jgi:hypothetical protein
MDVVLIQPRQKLSKEYARGNVIAGLPAGLLANASPVISVLAKGYAPIAKYRVKGMHYGFLPELKAAEMLGYKGY